MSFEDTLTPGSISYLSTLQQNRAEALQARPLGSLNGADRARHPQGHSSHSERDDEPPAAEETRAVERRRGRVFSSCATPHAGRRAGWEVLSPSWGCPLGQPDAKRYQGRIPPCVSERDSYFQVPLISGCSSLTARTQHSVVSTGSKSARVPACVLFSSLSAGRA